jgi:diacylglycerol O-acyltransferase
MAAHIPPEDNHLAYIDQAAFLGLRALGRGPLVQYTWIYDRPVDIEALRRFHANLSQGLLGRRIERSAVPFGRHHWVSWSAPAELDLSDAERPRAEAVAWADEQIMVPIDPEHGPPWRLAVQPLSGGGAAVTLIASHTVADALALGAAAAEAARGVTRDLGYPPPNARLRKTALKQDLRQTLRAIPEQGRAVAAMVRIAAKNRDELSSSAARSTPPATLHGDQPITIPALAAFVDIEEWDRCAESRGGTSNSLFAGVAARLGQLLGRVEDDGRVKLSIPVSERTEGDTRGNALTAITLSVDPAGVGQSLAAVRAEIKRNLSELNETRNELLAPLPLTPLVPRRLARKLEGMALGSGSPVGCSNIGALDPAANRPDGSDADYFWMRQMESRITSDILERLGGTLYLACGRMHGQVFLAASGWQVGGPNTRRHLAEVVAAALGDFGLTGVIEGVTGV